MSAAVCLAARPWPPVWQQLARYVKPELRRPRLVAGSRRDASNAYHGYAGRKRGQPKQDKVPGVAAGRVVFGVSAPAGSVHGQA
jgi:hypothetical protein